MIYLAEKVGLIDMQMQGQMPKAICYSKFKNLGALVQISELEGTFSNSRTWGHKFKFKKMGALF